MHEMSLMSEILKIVSQDAVLHGFCKVTQIEVIVGDLSNVLPDALELAFFHLRKDTVSFPINEKTELHIIRVPALSKCQNCHLEFEPDYQLARCPRCGIPDCLLISGEAFRVDSYEGSEENEN